MRDSEKRLILILILVGVVIIGGLLIWRNSRRNAEVPMASSDEENEVEEFVQVLDDGSRLNVSDALSKTKTVDGLEFKNMQLLESNSITSLLVDVENKSGTSLNTYSLVSIEFLDKNGSVITEVSGYLDPVNVGETVQMNLACSSSPAVANAYDFRITRK